MIFEGTAHKYGDDINTDYIIPSRFKSKFKDMREVSRYFMHEIDPDLVNRLKPGDFIVGGSNFGCGSSREAAPKVIQLNGVAAVLAKSFGRIFYRNAINIGLPAIECQTDLITSGERLKLDLGNSILLNLTTGQKVPLTTIEPFVKQILSAGGIVNFVHKYGFENAAIHNLA